LDHRCHTVTLHTRYAATTLHSCSFYDSGKGVTHLFVRTRTDSRYRGWTLHWTPATTATGGCSLNWTYRQLFCTTGLALCLPAFAFTGSSGRLRCHVWTGHALCLALPLLPVDSCNLPGLCRTFPFHATAFTFRKRSPRLRGLVPLLPRYRTYRCLPRPGRLEPSSIPAVTALPPH